MGSKRLDPPKIQKTRLITKNNVHIDQALKTPQFYFLWVVLCFNVTAGIGVIGVAKTMMIEIFHSKLTGNCYRRFCWNLRFNDKCI